MRVLLDENGYIKEWTMCSLDDGHIVLENGIEIPDICDPKDLDAIRAFDDEFESYHFVDEVMTRDDNKMEEVRHNRKVNRLRVNRETECFEVINRSNLWYNALTEAQKLELDAWYHAWLDVTDTMVVPEKPEWLK